ADLFSYSQQAGQHARLTTVTVPTFSRNRIAGIAHVRPACSKVCGDQACPPRCSAGFEGLDTQTRQTRQSGQLGPREWLTRFSFCAGEVRTHLPGFAVVRAFAEFRISFVPTNRPS